MKNLIPEERIEKIIYLMRKQKVMLDKDLADLYGVSTGRLIEQVSRNIERFPEDFMFRLNKEEYKILRSHFATSRWGGRRYLPYAFTEQGVAMLSSVLKSKKAVKVNIIIMRIFVKLRETIFRNKELTEKLNKLEQHVQKHDVEIYNIFKVIRWLTAPEKKKMGKIGFKTGGE